MIYEGWADMGPRISSFPPGAAELPNWRNDTITTSGCHDWNLDAVAQLNAADPDADVQLVPVASILSELLTTVLDDIALSDLYVDDAPHGTETRFCVASVIVCNASHGIPAPRIDLPDSIHPTVHNRRAGGVAGCDQRPGQHMPGAGRAERMRPGLVQGG